MKITTSILTVLAITSLAVYAADDAKKGDKKGAGKGKKGNPAEIFKRLDKDNSGSISKEEFMATPMAKKAGDKAEKMFGMRDKNNDGEISKEEFTAPRKKK
jgi:hypothetical protein